MNIDASMIALLRVSVSRHVCNSFASDEKYFRLWFISWCTVRICDLPEATISLQSGGTGGTNTSKARKEHMEVTFKTEKQMKDEGIDIYLQKWEQNKLKRHAEKQRHRNSIYRRRNSEENIAKIIAETKTRMF